MGQALQQLFDEGVVRRSDLVISTKWFRAGSGVNDKGLSRKKIYESAIKSLRNLQLEYIDLVGGARGRGGGARRGLSIFYYEKVPSLTAASRAATLLSCECVYPRSV